MQMPGKAGKSAGKKIRRIEIFEKGVTRGCTIPIVAMTADTSTAAREQCLSSGMDAIILKPLRLEKLRGLIESQLSGTVSSRGQRSAGGDNGKDAGCDAKYDCVPIDLEKALETAMGDGGFLKELLTMFIDATREQIGDIRSSAAAGQSDTAAKQAHRIKGGAANLDIHEIRKSACNLEKVARRQDIPGIERVTDKLETQLGALADFINMNAQVLSEQ